MYFKHLCLNNGTCYRCITLRNCRPRMLHYGRLCSYMCVSVLGVGGRGYPSQSCRQCILLGQRVPPPPDRVGVTPRQATPQAARLLRSHGRTFLFKMNSIFCCLKPSLIIYCPGRSDFCTTELATDLD